MHRLLIIAESLRASKRTIIYSEDFEPYKTRLEKQAAGTKSRNGRTDEEIIRDTKKGFGIEIGICKGTEKSLSSVLADCYAYDISCLVDSEPTQLEIKFSHGQGEYLTFNLNYLFKGINLNYFLNKTTTPFLVTGSYQIAEDGMAVVPHYVFHRDAFAYKTKGKAPELEYKLNYQSVMNLGLCEKI